MPQTEVFGVTANQFAEVSGQVSSEFLALIEVLKTQSEQQQSIKELTAALENTTNSLKAAHALHAGTMQSLPLIGSEQPEQQAPHSPVEPAQERGFFRKFFKK